MGRGNGSGVGIEADILGRNLFRLKEIVNRIW